MNPHPFQVPSLEELNTLLPAFDFTALLSANDFSAVFMAQQRSLDRDVAIKLLSPQISGNPEFRQSFESTARTMARLNHPNLIGVFDSGFVEGMLYFIMEFVPGKSLEHSARGQQVEVSQSIRLIEAVCDALSHAHAHGIFHGELDPGDILLNQKAEPKIGNFGFSHPLEDSAADSPYSAPEIRSGSPASAKSDIFAVGALLYQLVTGQAHGTDAAAPSTLCDCGPQIDAICKRATEPDPADRFDDMVSFRKALTDLAAAKPAGPVRNPPISQRLAAAPRKTDSMRPAQAQRTIVRKPAKTNWKLAANVVLNIVLLGSLPFAWKHFKETRARKEREFKEQMAREKSARDHVEETPTTPSPSTAHTPKTPDIPRAEPKPVPPGESPADSLDRLKDALAAGKRDEMPAGSVRQGDNDYFLVTEPMTWPEASGFAERHGGHLAIPSAGADLTWLAGSVAEKLAIWIGAARNSASTWALADGSPWSPKKEPNGTGTYLSLDRSGALRAESTKTKLPFIIQWHRDGNNPGSLQNLLAKTRASISGSSPVYPPGTLSLANRNYLYVAGPIAWKEAVDTAEKSGGHLVVTSETSEIAAVSSMLDSLSAPHGIWLGGFRKGDQWVWITGEPWKSAGWGNSRAGESEQSALVAFPMRGWDSRDLSEPASGFIIEWSNDRKSASAAQPATGSASSANDLAAKAKGLIIAANAKRTEQLVTNAKKLTWDLDIYLRGLAKGEQTLWAPHVERLKASVTHNRVPASIPQSSGIKLTAKMAEIARFCADKQARIDAEFLAEAEKIRSAYVARLKDSLTASRKAGQAAAARSQEESLSAATNLEEWVRSLGVEPKPESPLPEGAKPGKTEAKPKDLEESPSRTPLFE